MKMDRTELYQAFADYFIREYGNDPKPEIKGDLLSVAYTTDYAHFGDEEIPYEIQIVFNFKECQYECYIDQTMADTRRIESHEAVKEELETLEFEDLISDYMWDESRPPACVMKVVKEMV